MFFFYQIGQKNNATDRFLPSYTVGKKNWGVIGVKSVGFAEVASTCIMLCFGNR